MSDNGRVTQKSLALAAIKRAQEESQRADMSPVVLGALLEAAAKAVEAVQELVKPRKPRAAKAAAA